MAKRECPFCKEKVLEKATLCKHCRSALPPPPPKKWYRTPGGLILLVFALIVIGNVGKMLETPVPPLTPAQIAAKQQEDAMRHDEMNARIYAKHFVGKTLKAPTTAKWQDAGDFAVAPAKDKKGKPIKDIWEVSGYVDAQNSFGAMIRTEWYVKMKKSGTNWILFKMTPS